jgi:hypothetical protein
MKLLGGTSSPYREMGPRSDAARTDQTNKRRLTGRSVFAGSCPKKHVPGWK